MTRFIGNVVVCWLVNSKLMEIMKPETIGDLILWFLASLVLCLALMQLLDPAEEEEEEDERAE